MMGLPSWTLASSSKFEKRHFETFSRGGYDDVAYFMVYSQLQKYAELISKTA